MRATYRGIGLPFSKGGGLASRWNTLGPISITPEEYDTNDGATTITVGASGADYTSLSAATDAATAGAVIIDIARVLFDRHVITARRPIDFFYFSQGQDLDIGVVLDSSEVDLESAGRRT